MTRNNKIKVIFIPGNGGSGENLLDPSHENWFPWLKDELEKLGLKVIAEDWPDAQIGRQSVWLPHLKKLGADENTILIGWSTGAVAAMKFAEEHRILGSVLVGVYHTDLGIEDEKKAEYFNTPWKWENIRNNQKWIIQFSSTNDPFIPIAEAHFVQDKLQTEYYEMEDEHFGYPTPKFEFPELLKALESKIRPLQ